MNKIRFSIALLLLVISQVNVNAQTTGNEVGFFETVKDFLDNNVKNVGEYGANDINKVIFEKDGKKTVYAGRELSDWGFRDKRGFVWRVNNKQNYAIIGHGKIVVYARTMLKINKNEPKEITIDADQIYFSLGYDGEVFSFINDKKATIGAIADWMRKDNPALAEKVETDSYAFFPKNVKTAYAYVLEYNAAFSKEDENGYKFNLKVPIE
jgi:hypothetical protein